jgi:hypothetical protein
MADVHIQYKWPITADITNNVRSRSNISSGEVMTDPGSCVMTNTADRNVRMLLVLQPTFTISRRWEDIHLLSLV